MDESTIESYLKFLEEYFRPFSSPFHNQSARLEADGSINKDYKTTWSKPVTKNILLAHINGEKQIGVSPTFARKRPVDEQITTWCAWGCLDYDPPKDLDEREKEIRVIEFVQLITANYQNIHPCIEKSRSKGYHIWFFFKKPILSEVCWFFLVSLIVSTGMKDCEIFPKKPQRSYVRDTPGYFGNCLSLPICGMFVPEGKTCFYDYFVDDEGKPRLRRGATQLDYIEKIKKTCDKEATLICNNLDRKSLPAHFEIGFEKKNQVEKFSGGSARAGKISCHLLRLISSAEPKTKLNYASWFAICTNLALFENWEEIVDELVVDNSYFPKSRIETKRKIRNIISSGNVFGMRCDKTQCPFVGDKTTCPRQSISECINETEPENCPFELDDPEIDWDELKASFFEKLRLKEALWRQWFEGEFVKRRKIKNKDGEEEIQEEIMKFDDSNYRKKKTITKIMMGRLLRENFTEEEVFRMIPYCKYGLGAAGTKDVYWSLLCAARVYASAQIIKRIEDIEAQLKPGEKLDAEILYTPGRRLVGIYLNFWEENKITKEMELQKIPITNFVIKRKGFVHDKQFEEKNDLVDYYHVASPDGQPVKNVILPLECRKDLNLLLKTLDKISPSYSAECLTPKAGSPTNALRISMCSQDQKIKLREYDQVSSCGERPDLGAYFFGNSYLYEGKFHKLSPETKMLTLGDNKCWLSYNDTSDPTFFTKNPCPRYNHLHDLPMLFQIRDNFFEWAPISWGLEKDGIEALFAIWWFAATIFKKEIQQAFRSFPFVYVSGNRSVGKNHNSNIFAQFLGYEDWKITNVNQTSEAGLVRMVVPEGTLWLDELKPNPKCDRIQEMLKAAYDGSTFTKALLTDQSRVIDYRVRTSLYFTSQAMPSVEAFGDRSIILHMEGEWRQRHREESRRAMYQLLKHPTLGGLNKSELFSWIVHRKMTTELPFEVISAVEELSVFLQKELDMRERTALKYAIPLAAGQKPFFPCGNYPDHLFGFESFKKGELVGAMKFLEQVAREDKDSGINPVYPFFDAIVELASAKKEFSPFCFIEEEGGEDYISFSFQTGWRCYMESLARTRSTENVGQRMMLENLKKMPGYIGYHHKGLASLKKAGFSFAVYKFASNSPVFDRLKSIAVRVKDGTVVNYNESEDFEDQFFNEGEEDA